MTTYLNNAPPLLETTITEVGASSNSMTHDDNMVPPPFDEHTFHMSQIILRLPLALFGVITNIVNFVVFYRQGLLADSSTVTLTGFTMADFCTCLFSVQTGICMGFNLFADHSQIKWDVFMFCFVTSFNPVLMFNQISSWIMAHLAFERFVSVMFPFKVKFIFLAKSSLAVTVRIFLGTFILYLPKNFQHVPVNKIMGPENLTKVTFELASYATEDLNDSFLVLNPIILHTLSIILVVVFNFTIFYKVNSSQKFRKLTTAAAATTIQNAKPIDDMDETNNYSGRTIPEQSATKSSKDAVLLRMITIILCFVFTLCQLPYTVLVFWFYVGLGGEHHIYIRETLHTFVHIFLLLNASCNIFIYYGMSTRFRKELRLVFCKEEA